MMMKSTNTQPPPLHLPEATLLPSKGKDGEIDHLDFDWDSSDFGDTGSIYSMSTISTTIEAADDMLDFLVGFDYPCVVVYILDLTYHRAYNNALQLQPYWYNNIFINTNMANVVTNRFEHEQSPPQERGCNYSPRQIDRSSFEPRPAFQEGLPSDSADDVPLPTYLVRPRKAFQPPAVKRARVTPLPSPLPGAPAFIPPVYISIPNPPAHQDDV